MNYQLRITQSNGKSQVHALKEAELTIGSDASSDICLQGESKLLPRHILVAPQETQCWISTAKGAPLWDQEGQAVLGAFVPWGSRLTLGSCVFELQDLKTTEPDKLVGNPTTPVTDKGGESTKAPSPIIIMLLLCTFAYAALGFFEQPETMASGLPNEAPALFADEHGCTSKNAAHRAVTAEDEAFAKSERSVFVKQDGVSAVGLFAESEACFRDAGQVRDAEFVAARGQELRRELELEYKELRMRLSRALTKGDKAGASRQVKQLVALLRHQSNSSYVLSLRRLDLQLSKKELQP